MNSHSFCNPKRAAHKRNLQDGDVIKENVKMEIELLFCEEIILQEIGTKEATCDNIALTYAFCRDAKRNQNINFATINLAIIKRWNIFTLGYIQEKAAKLIENRLLMGGRR